MVLTVDDPGHPPQSQQDKETHPIEGVLVENEDNVQHEGHHHHQTIKHFKHVMEELQAVSKQLPCQLHHEEREKRQAEVMKHLHQQMLVSRIT